MMLSVLTQPELDELWNRMWEAVDQVRDELYQLQSCPVTVRNMCYGAGLLEQVEEMHADIIDILRHEIGAVSYRGPKP